MILCGFVLLCVVRHGCTWLHIVLHGCPWFLLAHVLFGCVASRGFAWFRVVSRGFVWFCVVSRSFA